MSAEANDAPVPYPFSFHEHQLEKLCRFCGCILTGYSYDDRTALDNEGKRHFEVEEIDEAFSITSVDDKTDIHPKRYCNKCYTALLNYRRRGCKPSFDVVKWTTHTEINCATCLLGCSKSKGGRPPKRKAPGKQKKVETLEDVMNLDPTKPLPKNVEDVISRAISIKMNQSSLPNRTVTISAGGNKNILLTPIVAPRKETTEVSSRTIRKRSQQSKDIIQMIAGSSKESFNTQTAAIVKCCDQELREEIMKGMKRTVTVPPSHVAAMKSCLNIPWYLLRDIRRWLATFKVNIAPEGKTRELAKEWIGSGLRTEYAPLTVTKNKKTVIVQKPWCYLFNLVGHVLNRLDNLEKNDLIVSHPFISKDEIVLKIGGDHGGGSFKMCYQLTCVEKPNSADNTVIFSIFEAKDNIANLRICLERFKIHVEKFKTVTWKNKVFRIFMFGDYAFLCAMFGISGPNGVHPCLWCLISKEEMQLPRFIRLLNLASKRTLESLKEHFQQFLDKYGGNLKSAKKVFNVIHSTFFDVPIDQIFIPGLHITLGVYLKMFNMFSNFCEEMDLLITHQITANNANNEFNNDNNEFVEMCRELRALNSEIEELEERRLLLQEEIAWVSISEGNDELLNQYDTLVSEVDKIIMQKQASVTDLKESFSSNEGPCFSSIDATLKKIGVQRQAYHSNCFVGNDCNDLLKDESIDTLCDSIPAVIEELNLENDEILTQAVNGSNQFRQLFTCYAKCHRVFNSAKHLSQDDIDILQQDITSFMYFFRHNWPDIKITPKLHMLEDHVVDFLSKWKTGCGFYGEQGGEAIHNVMNKKQTRYKNIKKDTDRLEYLMNDHLLACHPTPKRIRPKVQKRNFKGGSQSAEL